MLKKTLIVVALVASAVGSAVVAAGVANPLADDLAAETERADTLVADLASEAERTDAFRTDLVEAVASIDERADREREHLATIDEQAAAVDEQATAIAEAEVEIERRQRIADTNADRARAEAEKAAGLRDELEDAHADHQSEVSELESDISRLEDRLADKRRAIEASDDLCRVTYCTEERAFGLDLITYASWVWVSEGEADATIARLSSEFGVPKPTTSYGVSLGPNITGQYYSNAIEFSAPNGTYAWTLMHEFAHHLECHSGGACVGHHHDGFIESLSDILDAFDI
jgi:hypothetical protein